MKKLFALFMVVTILFNSGGYELFFQYLIYRSDSKTFDRINNNHYRSSDLVEIKVPVHFASQAIEEYSGEYELISGHIQIKNEKYEYAEAKFTQDTLYFRVIPTPELNKLVKANALYGKLVNDLPTSNTKHSNNLLIKKSLNVSDHLTFNYGHLHRVDIKSVYCNFMLPGILDPASGVDAQPPEA